MAAAQGYADGEQMPLDFVLHIVERIAVTTTLPLTVDFEGGYAVAPAEVMVNVSRVVEAGAVGINFEDQVVGGSGLHGIQEQAERIAAAREASARAGVSIFVNARTDLFLQEPDVLRHGELLQNAIERADAYQKAGADGFFVPGLISPDSIHTIRKAIALPLNVMMTPGAPSLEALADLGVARVSYGPGPYRQAMRGVAEAAAGLR